jgi:hypothetical protein
LAGSLQYYFVVTAYNSVGSADSDRTTTLIRPGAAQTITPINSSVTHGDLDFTDPATVDSGLKLSYARTSQSPTFAVAGRSVCTVDANGLIHVDLAGTCFISVSQNGTLEGTPSGTPSSFLPATTVQETVTVAASAPTPTTGLVFTVASGHLDIDWVAPTDDGGAPLTSYIIYWYRSDAPRPTDAEMDAAGTSSSTLAVKGKTTTAASITYCDLFGLDNGTTYTVEVIPVNAAGLVGAVS